MCENMSVDEGLWQISRRGRLRTVVGRKFESPMHRSAALGLQLGNCPSRSELMGSHERI
jgi:hypothetical protein